MKVTIVPETPEQERIRACLERARRHYRDAHLVLMGVGKEWRFLPEHTAQLCDWAYSWIAYLQAEYRRAGHGPSVTVAVNPNDQPEEQTHEQTKNGATARSVSGRSR